MIDTTKRLITINNGFRTATVPAGGTKFSFTIPGIQNPVDLKVTGTFTFITYSGDNEIMD